MDIKTLQKRYSRFIYEKYSYKISDSTNSPQAGNNLEIFFDFSIKPGIRFKPKIVIKNIDKSQIKMMGDRILNNLIFNLGLIEMISYWKATSAPEILIKAGSLNSEQIEWWQDLIMKGMGQFFYENKINFKSPNFLKISVLRKPDLRKTNGNRIPAKISIKLKNQVLVPTGGGKDSAVTLELLKNSPPWRMRQRNEKNIQCFSLNPTEAAQKIMKIAGCKKPIVVKREIDKKLLELNQKGFLNGHTPFSAYLAFLSVLAAALSGQKYIAVSNERSSDEGNVKYLGETINHQWSKSFEFEKKFRAYSKKYLAKDVEYFSFLRPLYEIQIAKLFSKYSKYFSAFLSCNEVFKTASGTKKPINSAKIASRSYGKRKWCGNCPKCLFVFAALYSFIEEKKLIKIFGRNLFETPKEKSKDSHEAGKNPLSIMQELVGERGFKPFECVGTKRENLIAFYLSWKKYRESRGEPFSAKLPFLLEYFEKEILPKRQNLEKESKKILNSCNNQNNLPIIFKKILQKMSFHYRW